MTRPIFAACFGVSIFALTVTTAAAQSVRGAQLAATCAACHRFDGRSTGIPPLISLGGDQIVKMMKAYKASTRANHIMHAVSLSLSDNDVVAVARYLDAIGKETTEP